MLIRNEIVLSEMGMFSMFGILYAKLYDATADMGAQVEKTCRGIDTSREDLPKLGTGFVKA